MINLLYKKSIIIKDVIKLLELEENASKLQELSDRLQKIGDSL